MSLEKKLIHWFKENENELLKFLMRYSKTIPSPMNQPDYRSEISGFFCKNLEFAFYNVLRDEPSKGYDMVFICPKTEERIRVSVKIAKILFQREKKNGKGLTKPKKIILVNSLGKRGKSEKEDIEKNFDVLLAVQRGCYENNYTSQFGIASYNKINNSSINVEGDQIKVKLQDEEWDFLSQPLKEKNINFDLLNEVQEKLTEEFHKDKKECYKKYFGYSLCLE